MKQKYETRLKQVRNLLNPAVNNKLQLENANKYCDIAVELLDDLLASRDFDVLCELLTFFNEENEQYGGLCEHLKSEITLNYSLDQILEAFYKKFDLLIKNDIEICVEMSMWFFDGGKFEDFRKMFNTVKSEKSELFLQEFEEWYPDLKSKITLLKEDMKKW